MSETISKSMGELTSALNALPTWAKVGAQVVVGGGIALYVHGQWNTRSRPVNNEWVKGRIYLYQFPRSLVVPSLSPFSLKLETWMRMAGLDYENSELPAWEMYSSIRSKEGTLPFVEVDGVEYDDSDLIMRDLAIMKDTSSMTAHLDARELGVLRAVDKMVENSALMSYSYFRYTQHFETVMGERVVSTHDFSIFQHVSYALMKMFMKPAIKKAFKAIPICKHPEHEIKNIGFDDLKALSHILGGNPYFGGQKPTATDACVFSVLAQILYIPIDVPHLEFVRNECKNLVAHTELIKNEFWPDWQEATVGLKPNSTWKKN